VMRIEAECDSDPAIICAEAQMTCHRFLVGRFAVV
jgi:hypothetical protein